MPKLQGLPIIAQVTDHGRTTPHPDSPFFELSNKKDSAPLDRCFVTDAAVHDEKQTHQGLTEIRNWFIEAKKKYSYTAEPLEMEEQEATVIVRARVSGNFPAARRCFATSSNWATIGFNHSLSVKPARFSGCAARSSSRSVSTSKPSEVTAMVCSHWAERRLSRVTTVQPSGLVRTAALP